MNDENLIPLNKRNKEEAKKIQLAGGIARGKQRTEEKTFSQLVKIAFGEYLEKKHKGKDITIQEGIILKALQQSLNGDAKARDWITKVVGESVENVNLTGDLSVQKIFVSEKEQEEIEKKIDEMLNNEQ